MSYSQAGFPAENVLVKVVQCLPASNVWCPHLVSFAPRSDVVDEGERGAAAATQAAGLCLLRGAPEL